MGPREGNEHPVDLESSGRHRVIPVNLTYAVAPHGTVMRMVAADKRSGPPNIHDPSRTGRAGRPWLVPTAGLLPGQRVAQMGDVATTRKWDWECGVNRQDSARGGDR